MQIPADNWSFFFAAHLQCTSDANLDSSFEIVGPFANGTATQYPLRVVINTTRQFALYAAGGSRRVTPATYVSPTETPHLFMVTFSSTDGLKLMVDGVAVVSDNTILDPLNFSLAAGDLFLFRRSGLGTAATNPITKSLFSPAYMVNRDLSLPENLPYMVAINRYMMQTYVGA